MSQNGPSRRSPGMWVVRCRATAPARLFPREYVCLDPSPRPRGLLSSASVHRRPCLSLRSVPLLHPSAARPVQSFSRPPCNPRIFLQRQKLHRNTVLSARSTLKSRPGRVESHSVIVSLHLGWRRKHSILFSAVPASSRQFCLAFDLSVSLQECGVYCSERSRRLTASGCTWNTGR